jgi:hypothetical protein
VLTDDAWTRLSIAGTRRITRVFTCELPQLPRADAPQSMLVLCNVWQLGNATRFCRNTHNRHEQTPLFQTKLLCRSCTAEFCCQALTFASATSGGHPVCISVGDTQPGHYAQRTEKQ